MTATTPISTAIMTSKQRLVTALDRGAPDRLPVTTHHVMQYFLDTYMNSISIPEFFDYFGFDAITWPLPHKPDPSQGEYYDPEQQEVNFLESNRIVNNNWRIHTEEIPGREYRTRRYSFTTPKGALTMELQSNEHTSWVTEHLIKNKRDIDILGEYMTAPKCDVDEVNRIADDMGERGLVRGIIAPFDVFGQAGCWQDACCLYGTQELIYETYDDPEWVHELLKILHRRKRVYLESCKGARYDLLEHGGGSASTTVISPKVFDTFVAPYDADLTKVAQEAGHRVVYHTCGGMMPLLERIVEMGPNVMETFTPAAMGADVDLAAAKRRIGDKVCMIGGFDQFHFFTGCTPQETRAEVRRCWEAAGEGGGYILCPSDHFFDADVELIRAFVDEAHQCTY